MTNKTFFYVQLVWNREFEFVNYGSPHACLKDAIKECRALENMGDGERVKKTRILDDQKRVVWQYGKLV